MANTTVCAASTGHHPLTSTNASTTVVRTAAKRGPRGSTMISADIQLPEPGGREGVGDGAVEKNGSAGTQAAAHAAEIHRTALRQQIEGQPVHIPTLPRFVSNREPCSPGGTDEGPR